MMALYLSAILCQTSGVGLQVHLQRQPMNLMGYMGLSGAFFMLGLFNFFHS